MFALLTIFAAAFAQDEQSLLGICGLYKAAYPMGHTDADLSTPILSLIPFPEETMTMARDMGVAETTTEQYLEVYLPQQEFCGSNAALIEPVVEDFQSEGDLNPASMELLEVVVFEIAAVLDSSASAQVAQRRRNAGWAIVIVPLVFGAMFVMVFMLVYEISRGCRRRRLAITAPQGPRLLKKAARRELSTESFEVPALDLLEACSHGNIDSFVCSMSTLEFTHTLTSQFCGGSASLSSCFYNPQYALGYLASLH